MSNLKELCTGLNIRYYSVLLVGFAGGSKEASAIAIYVRLEVSKGKFWIYLLTSKNRVSPPDIISIPRIELLAVVLLSNTMPHCYACLQFHCQQNLQLG
jgi:hypothetical protein